MIHILVSQNAQGAQNRTFSKDKTASGAKSLIWRAGEAQLADPTFCTLDTHKTPVPAFSISWNWQKLFCYVMHGVKMLHHEVKRFSHSVMNYSQWALLAGVPQHCVVQLLGNESFNGISVSIVNCSSVLRAGQSSTGRAHLSALSACMLCLLAVTADLYHNDLHKHSDLLVSREDSIHTETAYYK